MKVSLQITSDKGTSVKNIGDNKRIIISLIEPTIEFSVKCILNGASEVCLGLFICNSTARLESICLNSVYDYF